MQKIPIDLARPGMKLARPVLKDGGMVIMAEGMELTDSLIARLATMKIDRITVAGHPVDLGGAGGGTRYAERVQRLEVLFRRYGEDRWMARVKERMVRYFRIKAAAQEAKMKAAQDATASSDNGAAGAGE